WRYIFQTGRTPSRPLIRSTSVEFGLRPAASEIRLRLAYGCRLLRPGSSIIGQIGHQPHKNSLKKKESRHKELKTFHLDPSGPLLSGPQCNYWSAIAHCTLTKVPPPSAAPISNEPPESSALFFMLISPSEQSGHVKDTA